MLICKLCKRAQLTRDFSIWAGRELQLLIRVEYGAGWGELSLGNGTPLSSGPRGRGKAFLHPVKRMLLRERRQEGRDADGALAPITHRSSSEIYDYAAFQRAPPRAVIPLHQCPQPRAQQDSCHVATGQTEVIPDLIFCDTQPGDPILDTLLWTNTSLSFLAG